MPRASEASSTNIIALIPTSSSTAAVTKANKVSKNAIHQWILILTFSRMDFRSLLP
ncbi:Hypothetical predicted protein, partial [Paramuricea clavata]